MSQAISDFWLGALVTTTLGLGLVVTVGLSVLGWCWAWLARYAKVSLDRSDRGDAVVNVHLSGNR